MARIRTIKPEFPHSETLGRVSRDARLLFVNLFTIADDEGRARASSRLLASLLYPFDTDAAGLIDGWLTELQGVGAIALYQSGDTKYLVIPKWLEHQKIDRPSKSRIPAFDESSRIVAKPREPSATDLGPRTVDLGTPPSEDASASLASDPLKSRIWGPALDWLCKATKQPQAKIRPMVGKWVSDYGDGGTLEAIEAASKNAPLAPIPYINKILKAPRNERPDAETAFRRQLSAIAGATGFEPMETGGPGPADQIRIGSDNPRIEGGARAGEAA